MLVGGALAPPPNSDGHLLRTYDLLTITPIFKIAILRRENCFSPECRSKVAKFVKNDRLDVLIVLAKDEHLLFFP